MPIDSIDKSIIEGYVTAVGTTEASFRTGMSHIIDQVDASESEVLPEPGSKFYTASGNYTVPAGVAKVLVTGISGGGGGGTENSNGYAGGGGGGARVFKTEVSVTGGDVHVVSIGAGGSAGSSGDATSLGSLVVMNGGANGGNANSSSNQSGGAGGTISGNHSGGVTHNGGTGTAGTYARGYGATGMALMPTGYVANNYTNATTGNREDKRGWGGTRNSGGYDGFLIIEVGE
jgi:hypothetical protein